MTLRETGDDPTIPRAEKRWVLSSGAVAVAPLQVVRNQVDLEQSVPVPRLKVVRNGELPPTFAGVQVVREGGDDRSASLRLIVRRAIEEVRANHLEELTPILCALYREPSLVEKIFRLPERGPRDTRLAPHRRLLFRLAGLKKSDLLLSRLSEIYFGEETPGRLPIPLGLVGSPQVAGNPLLRVIR